MQKNLYNTLFVDPTADESQIKASYEKLLKEYQDMYDKGDENAHILIFNLKGSYEVLSNPEKRKEYDTRLSLKPPQPASRAEENPTSNKTTLGKTHFLTIAIFVSLPAIFMYEMALDRSSYFYLVAFFLAAGISIVTWSFLPKGKPGSIIVSALSGVLFGSAMTILVKPNDETLNGIRWVLLIDYIQADDMRGIKRILGGSYSPNYDDLLYKAIQFNKPSVVKYILEKGGNPNAVFPDEPALCMAVKVKGGHDVVSALIEHDANVDIKCSESNNLLYTAKKWADIAGGLNSWTLIHGKSSDESRKAAVHSELTANAEENASMAKLREEYADCYKLREVYESNGYSEREVIELIAAQYNADNCYLNGMYKSGAFYPRR